jgi:hypothetical protein
MTKSYEAKVALIERFQARTAADIVNKLNKEINAAIADRKMKSRLAEWAKWRFQARPPTSENSSRRLDLRELRLDGLHLDRLDGVVDIDQSGRLGNGWRRVRSADGCRRGQFGSRQHSRRRYVAARTSAAGAVGTNLSSGQAAGGAKAATV